MGIQASHGYFRFEPMLYVKGLFLVEGISFALFAVLAIALQSVLNNRYLGYLLMVLVFISNPVLSALGWEHRALPLTRGPRRPLLGHERVRPFRRAAVLVRPVLGLLRGPARRRDPPVLGAGRRHGAAPAPGASRAGASARPRARSRPAPWPASRERAAGSTTTRTSSTATSRGRSSRTARRPTRRSTRSTRSSTAPASRPCARTWTSTPSGAPPRSAARYTLRNKTDHPIEEVHLTINPDVKIRTLELPGSRVTMQDDELGFIIRKLDAPLAPGAETTLAFEVSVVNDGFLANGAMTKIVENGTFFNNSEYFPHFGYWRERQLEDPNERRKRGLEPVVRFPKLEDESARKNTYISHEADWVTFETTVSTSADQIAIAPGYLQKEWTEGGRRYFHYKMDAPILDFWSLPVGALGGEARPLERRRHRGLLPPRAPLQRGPDDRGVEEVAGLLHEELRPLPAPAGAHHRVPALRALRAVVPEHHPVLGEHRLHRADRRSPRTSTTSSTSRRTRSRTSGGRTR